MPKGQNESLNIYALLQTTFIMCLSVRAKCLILTCVLNKVTKIGIFHSSFEHQLTRPGTSGLEVHRPKGKGINDTVIFITVDQVIRINNPATADTTGDTKDRTTVPTHVLHRLQDNVIGMAGMDGVKPTLRLPFLALHVQFTDTTVGYDCIDSRICLFTDATV